MLTETPNIRGIVIYMTFLIKKHLSKIMNCLKKRNSARKQNIDKNMRWY